MREFEIFRVEEFIFEELIHNFGDVMSTRNEQEKFKCFVRHTHTQTHTDRTIHIYIYKLKRDAYKYTSYVKIVSNDQNEAGIEKMNLSNGHKAHRNKQT